MPDAAGVEADDFRRLIVDLRQHEARLDKALRRNIRRSARPVVQSLKRKIDNIPAKSNRHDLRNAMARAVTLEIASGKNKSGVFIKIKQSKMPPGKRKLPRLLDNPRGFRHPIYGSAAGDWAHQAGHPYFDAAIDPHVEPLRRAVLAAMDEAAAAAGFR